MLTLKTAANMIFASLVLATAAEAQSADLVLRCQSPRHQTDFMYIGLNQARTNADVVSFSSSGIFESGTALGVRVDEERYTIRLQVNEYDMSINRTSLALTSTRYFSSAGSNITNRYACVVQSNDSELNQAISRYQREVIQQEIERQERLDAADAERQI